jgi:hypothetical protein
MPLHIFTNQTPLVPDPNVPDGAPGVSLGTLWYSDKEGVVRGVRFYLGSRNYDGASITCGIYDFETGDILTQVNYVITAANPIGFVSVPLPNQLLIKQNRRYITTVWFPCDLSPDGKAHYAFSSSIFDEGEIGNPPLHAMKDETILNRRNGLFNYGPALAYPSSHANGACYFIDIDFDYVARMPVYNNSTGTYEQKVIKYRQGGTWKY